MQTLRRGIVGSAVCVAALAFVPQAGFAASTCSFSAGTITVTGSGLHNDSVDLAIDASSQVTSDGVTCGGTTATTEQIVVSTPTRVGIDITRPFLGGTAELDGASEIEISLNQSNLVRVTTAAAADDHIIVGQSGTTRRLNLTGWAPGDDDADIVIPNVANQTVVEGGPGSDNLSAAGGRGTGNPLREVYSVSLVGGDGHDTLTGPGHFAGGKGDDTLIAVADHGVGFFHGTLGPVRMKPDLSGTEIGFDGSGGTDTYVGFATASSLWTTGGEFDDVLYGGSGSDDLSGLGGDDWIEGRGGDDRLSGALGADWIDGGAGHDILTGGGVADSPNTLIGGPGNDDIRGGDAADTILALDGEFDTIACKDGIDVGKVDRADNRDSDCEMTPPTVSIVSATATEGTPVSFVVSLSEALPVAASVVVAFAPASATAADFAVGSTNVSFAAGETSKPVTAATVDDALDEPVETFTATLSSPSAAPALGTAVATGTINDDDAAVITVTRTPGAADGGVGYYLSGPMLRVVANFTDGDVRCVLDPSSAPMSFSELPPGACDFAGMGMRVLSDGPHELCAAGSTPREQTAVVCDSWRTDATAPVVTCPPAPSFMVGEGAQITAAVSDALSGPVASEASAPADTSAVGERGVAVSGADLAGNTARTTCSFNVQSVAPPESEPPVAVADLMCGAPLTLLGLSRSGREVRLAGIARPEFVGRTVSLLAAGEQVGSAVVGHDGSFSVRLKAPKRALRSTIRYQAVIGTAKSRALKLERLVRIMKRSGLTVSGKIVAPKRVLPKRMVFYRQLTCTKLVRFGSAKLRRDGTFSIKLERPLPSESVAIFRGRAKLKRGKTYTMPIAMR